MTFAVDLKLLTRPFSQADVVVFIPSTRLGSLHRTFSFLHLITKPIILFCNRQSIQAGAKDQGCHVQNKPIAGTCRSLNRKEFRLKKRFSSLGVRLFVEFVGSMNCSFIPNMGRQTVCVGLKINESKCKLLFGHLVHFEHLGSDFFQLIRAIEHGQNAFHVMHNNQLMMALILELLLQRTVMTAVAFYQ